ncbi:MAG TPA: AMP-binding protein [Actinomycetes bacterium]
MLLRRPGVTYEALREGFAWQIPARFNMGAACADRHPAGDLALVEIAADGAQRDVTFGELTELSNRFANALRGLGVGAGDRVGIVLPQRLETGLAHLAVYKLGAIAVPLSGLFGPDALRYRLGDSDARVVVTEAAALDRVAEVARDLGGVEVVVAGPEVTPPHRDFWELARSGSADLEVAATEADTPALLIYTSGTTGPPKGALHGQRVLLGHLPGFDLSHDFFPQPGDRFWTPADWAWIGGLMDALVPSWYHGRPVVAAARQAFDPAWASDLIRRHGVRNAFLPPTALKLMRQAGVRVPHGTLRSVMSGGEPLGEELQSWGRDALGVWINEIYGQTEANYVVGNSSAVWEVRPGSMGRPYPGHDVVVLRDDGSPAATGEVGEIAVRAPDPVLFLAYWERPDATREKVVDGWLRTGDLGRIDGDGWFWFEARADDVINSAGYRIGPAEIEECLLHHPAVALAAAIGVPDELRGQVVKAFIKLADGATPSEELKEEIRSLVRSRLAAYEYPRHIEFVDALPMTTTGKIRRAELRRIEAERR